MRNLLFAVLVVLLDAVGCGHTQQPEIHVNVSTDRIELDSQKGASAVFSISTSAKNVSWRILYDPEWLAVNPESGHGDGEIVVTALSSNNIPSTRYCQLSIESLDRTRYILVEQVANQ